MKDEEKLLNKLFYTILFYDTTVSTCIGLHASFYGYLVIIPVHLYCFFEAHASILKFLRKDGMHLPWK